MPKPTTASPTNVPTMLMMMILFLLNPESSVGSPCDSGVGVRAGTGVMDGITVGVGVGEAIAVGVAVGVATSSASAGVGVGVAGI